MARRRPSLHLIPAILLAFCFVAGPGLLFSLLPEGLFAAWDGLVAPLRAPVTRFWWGYIRGGDQQLLFNLLTYLSLTALLVLPWIVLRLAWIRQRRNAGRFR